MKGFFNFKTFMFFMVFMYIKPLFAVPLCDIEFGCGQWPRCVLCVHNGLLQRHQD